MLRVHVERVTAIPHGGRIAIDQSTGEDLVIWVLESQVTAGAARVIAAHLALALAAQVAA